jgi:hypothetical protein
VARPDRRHDERVARLAGGEGLARGGGRVVGGGFHCGGEVDELVERRLMPTRVNSRPRGESGAPDVDEDAAQVVGVVVPALARGAPP